MCIADKEFLICVVATVYFDFRRTSGKLAELKRIHVYHIANTTPHCA